MQESLITWLDSQGWTDREKAAILNATFPLLVVRPFSEKSQVDEAVTFMLEETRARCDQAWEWKLKGILY